MCETVQDIFRHDKSGEVSLEVSGLLVNHVNLKTSYTSE